MAQTKVWLDVKLETYFEVQFSGSVAVFYNTTFHRNSPSETSDYSTVRQLRRHPYLFSRQYDRSNKQACMAVEATPELPENHPTIVGSVWEQENFILCVDGHPFSQPSLWRNVLRLAHSFRASNGTFVDCCDTLLLSPVSPRAQVASASCRSHSTLVAVKHAVSVDTSCTYKLRSVQRCNHRDGRECIKNLRT